MSLEWAAGVIRAASLEEHQNVVSEVWDLDFSPLVAGQLSSKTVFLATPRMVVYDEHWDRPIHLRGALGKGQVAFAIPTREGLPFRLGGKQVGPAQIPWMSDAGELDIVTTDRYRNVVMIFDAKFLQGIAAQVQHPFARTSLHSQPIASQAHAGKTEHLRWKVESMLRDVELRSAGRLSREARASRMDEHLAAALLDTLVLDPGDASEGVALDTSTQRYQAVRECIDYSRSRGFDVTIPELCGLIGKSRRTLEYAFQESIGVSPARLLYYGRLRGVHWDLIAGRPEGITVTRVATRWGFFELGRFAGAYRQYFHELPSETLRRSPRTADSIPLLGAGRRNPA